MQLLVRVVDKKSDDPVIDVTLTKRGDVIAVRADDADWGVEELLHPEYCLIQCDLTEEQAKALLVTEKPPANVLDQPVARRRFRLDLDALGISFVRTSTYDKDQLTVPDIVCTSFEVLAAKVMKPVTKDPRTLGNKSDTIGPV